MDGDSNRLIVAVDGGGSTCRACVSDLGGKVLGRATGSPANINTDIAGSRINILETIGRAYKDAELSIERSVHDYAILGLAGASISDSAANLQDSLNFFRTCVTTDKVTTVQGALGDKDGTVALLGTGSFFVARHAGVTRNIGGWGFRLGDDGAGANLGLALLRLTVKAYDGLIKHSPLTKSVLQEYGGTPNGMVRFAQMATPLEFGRLAPKLVDAFEGGDKNAEYLIDQAVVRLEMTLENLGALSNGALFLLGGLGPFYQSQLSPALREICQKPNGDALAGAISLAQAKLVGAAE